MLAIGNKKQCSSCRLTLPLNKFFKNKYTQDKLQNVCNNCKAILTRNWKYGLKSGQIEQMKIRQQNRCAICKEIGKELVLDHNHKTGKIRGLLFRYCNAILGMARDQIDILKEAINYLIKDIE